MSIIIGYETRQSYGVYAVQTECLYKETDIIHNFEVDENSDLVAQ